jgi:alkylated DNA repair dioxygenase AlkB
MPRSTATPTLFDVETPLPEGFIYMPEFLTGDEERALLDRISTLQFGDVRMHGVVARRRIVQYGHNYSFDSSRVSAGVEIPEFLRPLRSRVANVAAREPEAFAELLITEYPPGATIGWHRDAPAFDIVAGVSLLAACRFRLRRYDRTGDVLSLAVEPRSLYIMAGAARSARQHNIPPTPALRYSITFRTLRRQGSRRPPI